MRFTIIITLLITSFCLNSFDVSAQVKVDLKKKIQREANKRANKKADKAVSKSFDNLEKGLKGLLTGEEGEKSDSAVLVEQAGQQQEHAAAVQKQGQANTASPTLKWSKYDFVPGDKIIFEDNLAGEENGEFPSRWDLQRGTVENAVFGEDNVIMFRGGSPTIIPYIKNANIDYLPEVFTVEFDLYLPGNSFTVLFYDRKNQSAPRGSSTLDIWHQTMDLGQANSRLPGKESIAKRWVHIAIAYTHGKMKAYIDETRLINIPHLHFEPTGISLHAYHASDQARYYVKNFRIAEGGVKYYDRFLQDGKIVSNGIRFDVGKASLRPESMGVINEIYKMLSDHPEVNVSIEGHTDSDGETGLNQKLSEERAASVMNRLIYMGISSDRLSSKGFGESKPVNANASPEGKAENRRVEFVRSN